MNPDILRIIAVTQGVACMLGVVAVGVYGGYHVAPRFAVVSLGFAYLSTAFFLFDKMGAPDGAVQIGNVFAGASVLFGVIAVAGLI